MCCASKLRLYHCKYYIRLFSAHTVTTMRKMIVLYRFVSHNLIRENKDGLMESDETRRVKSERDEVINDLDEYKEKNNELLQQ